MLKIDSNSSVYIGQEIVGYNLDTKVKVYYYPIYINNKCMLMASRTDSSEISISTDIRLYEQLCNIDLDNSTYLLTIYDGRLFIENQEGKIASIDYKKEIGMLENSQNKFDRYDFQQKIEFIEDVFDCNLIAVTENKRSLLNLNSFESSLYSFPINNSIDISQAAVIQQYENCWAATAATVINHKIGTVGPVMRYTAEMICDELGIGYDSEGIL